MSGKKLIIGITAPSSVNLLHGQLSYFRSIGYETYLMAPKDQLTIKYCEIEDCRLLPVQIHRDIYILHDLISLFIIYFQLRKIKPDIVNMGTPKMGLLGLVAAWLLGVNRRIYTCRGFRYEHETGIQKLILKITERICGHCADTIVCISQSVKDVALRDKIFSGSKCQIIKMGSSNGINLNKFNPNAVDQEDKIMLRQKLKLEGKIVYGFVGRMIDRKGISELFSAFSQLFDEFNNVILLLVGPIEDEQISDKSLIQRFKNHPGILTTGKTDDVPLYLSLMDVFVLPAWWEGFGNVVVEAAAMGLPVISTTGTGTRDAVNNNYNGLLVEPKSVEALKKAMLLLYEKDDLRMRMAKNGSEWAKNFDNKFIWEGLRSIYEQG
jgi:glycosyltransferase involved in cell wall biosynthesis